MWNGECGMANAADNMSFRIPHSALHIPKVRGFLPPSHGGFGFFWVNGRTRTLDLHFHIFLQFRVILCWWDVMAGMLSPTSVTYFLMNSSVIEYFRNAKSRGGGLKRRWSQETVASRDGGLKRQWPQDLTLLIGSLSFYFVTLKRPPFVKGDLGGFYT